MDHSRHERLSAMELNQANIVNATVYGPGDERIGTVSHVHGAAPDAKVVVDAGGFLGIGSKPVALDMARLDFMRDGSGEVHATTMMTRDEVKSLPEHDG